MFQSPAPMGQPNRRFLPLTVGMALLGAVAAELLRRSVGDVRGTEALRPLALLILACPAGLLLGWTLAAPREFWRALLAAACVYVLGVLFAARLEHLLLGRERANAELHTLYFQLVMWCQLALGLLAAGWRAWRRTGSAPRAVVQ